MADCTSTKPMSGRTNSASVVGVVSWLGLISNLGSDHEGSGKFERVGKMLAPAEVKKGGARRPDALKLKARNERVRRPCSTLLCFWQHTRFQSSPEELLACQFCLGAIHEQPITARPPQDDGFRKERAQQRQSIRSVGEQEDPPW